MSQYRVSGLLAVLLFGCGCSGGPELPERIPTVPVTGTVKLNGQPTPFISLYLFPADNAPGGIDVLAGASSNTAQTDQDGKFAFSSYDAGDGAPVGNYVVGFYWPGNAVQPLTGNDDEPVIDRVAQQFNMKYGNPSKSEFKVNVEAGKPVDMGTLELTTN